MKKVSLSLIVALSTLFSVAPPIAAPAVAADKFVCAAADATCGGTPAYATSAAANAVATSGDRVLFKAGELFTGTLIAKNGVTYQTAVTTLLPAAGNRIDPSYDPLLATIQGLTGGAPAITVPVGAHDVVIKQLRFRENPGGFSDVIRVGQNDTTQQFKSELPYNVTIDQIVIESSLVVGQKRGVSMNGTNVSLTNSWIRVNSVGQDSQCAQAVNTFGPVHFDNNYCTGGAEGGLFTGADQAFIKTHASVKSSPTPTSTVFTLECFTGESCDAERGTLVVGTGSTLTSIVIGTLNGGAGSVNDDTYVGRLVRFTSGTQSGVTTGLVTAYVGGTKRLTVATLTGSAPVSGDTAWLLERTHTIGDLSVGDHIACVVAGQRQHSFVTAISGNQVTVGSTDPAFQFTAPPTSPGDCRWGANVSDVTVTKNHIYKDLAWRSPILAAPQGVNAVASVSGGTLPAGNPCYVVIPNAVGYANATIYGAESGEVCAPTTGTTSSVTITWSPVAGATSYKVWGRSSGAQTLFFSTSGTTFTDTGAAGSPATKSSQRNTKWTAKKLFEIKACIRCLIDKNVFDGNWQDGQTGFAISFKSSNAIVGSQYPNSYVLTKDVTFSNNVIRNTAGLFVIVGQEFESHAVLDDPAPVTNLTVVNNLGYNSSNAFQTTGSNYAMDFSNAANGFTFERNTMSHLGGGLVTLSGTTFTGTNLLRNNLMPSNTYGVKGQGIASGSASLTAYAMTTAYDVIGGIVGGTSVWPTTASTHNIYPSQATFQGEFVNYGGSAIGDYKLKDGSAYATAASDGGRLGADIAALETYAAAAISGAAANAPIWQTGAALPAGTVGTAYSVTLVATGGTGSKTCALTGGSLPASVALSSACVLAGTPSAPATSSFSVRNTDSAGLSADRTFSITVAPAAVGVTIQTAMIDSMIVGAPYSVQITASGGTTGVYAFNVSNGLPPNGITLQPTGLLSGACNIAGSYTFSIQATSGAQVSPPQQYQVTCSATGGTITPGDAGRAVSMNGQEVQFFAHCDLTADDDVRVKDLCINDAGKMRVVISTSSAIVTRAVGLGLRMTFQADNSETLVPVLAGSAFPLPFELRADMSEITECRVHVYIFNATVTGATLGVQYFDGVNWVYQDGVGGPSVAANATGIKDSDWTALADAAKIDAPLRVFVSTGDGSNDLIVGNISEECR